MHLWHAYGHLVMSETAPAGALPARANDVAGRPVFLLVDAPGAPGLERLAPADALDRALGTERPLPEPLAKAAAAGLAYRVNTALVDWQRLLSRPPILPAVGARVQLLALGDVGATFLLALTLLNEGEIAEIGIYDIDPKVSARYAFELGQMARADGSRPLPRLRVLTEADLFSGADVFVFAASAYVPAPGQEAGDVRQAQYEKNARILAPYAEMAAERGYEGLFVVLSDPVERLTAAAHRAARGCLRPEQVTGFGLGVMAARGRYLAAQKPAFADFLKAGRAYGCHGAGLVLANDPAPGRYDDALSRAMTERAAGLNYELRALGFKPFLAPAVSSGAMTLLALLRREPAYATQWLGGIPFGVYGSLAADGQWTRERSDLDPALAARIAAEHARLASTIAADANDIPPS